MKISTTLGLVISAPFAVPRLPIIIKNKQKLEVTK
jgi:hypothetical protein